MCTLPISPFVSGMRSKRLTPKKPAHRREGNNLVSGMSIPQVRARFDMWYSISPISGASTDEGNLMIHSSPLIVVRIFGRLRLTNRQEQTAGRGHSRSRCSTHSGIPRRVSRDRGMIACHRRLLKRVRIPVRPCRHDLRSIDAPAGRPNTGRCHVDAAFGRSAVVPIRRACCRRTRRACRSADLFGRRTRHL